jgi:ribosome-binding factor A
MASQRAERVGRQILQEISAIAEQDLADPRLRLVTFTDVRMSPDLRLARVSFSSLAGEQARREALVALEHATGLIRRELGRRLSLRYVPELRFQPDDSLDVAQRISDLAAAPKGGGSGGSEEE